jgi:hypothetical protein
MRFHNRSAKENNKFVLGLAMNLENYLWTPQSLALSFGKYCNLANVILIYKTNVHGSKNTS